MILSPDQDLTDQFAGLEAGKRQWEWIEKHSASWAVDMSQGDW